jgi:citrate lyase beta subunit
MGHPVHPCRYCGHSEPQHVRRFAGGWGTVRCHCGCTGYAEVSHALYTPEGVEEAREIAAAQHVKEIERGSEYYLGR